MSPPKPRILMTTDAVGGVWTFAAGLTRRLCDQGHAVTLATMGPPPRRDQVEQLAGLPTLSLEITDLALEWMDAEGRDLPRARDVLRRIADRARPDIVHLNSFREASFAFGAPVLAVAHSCVGSWWQACRPQQPIEPKWHVYLRNVAAGLDAADLWAAPTAAYRDWIEGFYRPRRRGRVVWNGTDIAVTAGVKARSILAAGRLWDEAKNLRLLAQVAADLDWPVAVAGPLRGGDGAAATAGDALHLLGELPHAELLAEMRRAAVFAAPALYEPFGLGILEAAGCGCALVLSDIASLRELWRDAALFVQSGSAGALREALQTLCRDETLRARLAAAARRRARRYSLDATVRGYRRIYRDLTPPAPAPQVRPAPPMELHP